MTTKSAIAGTSRHSHIDYSLQPTRWFLKPIGAWPAMATTSTCERVLSIVSNVICYSSLLFVVIICLPHAFLEADSVYTKLKSLGPVSHWFVSSINYTTLLLRRREIRYCVEHMETDWRTTTREKDQEVMLKYAKLGRYVATFCAAFMQGGVLSFCVVQALSTEVILVGNETRIVHALPCPVYKKLMNVDDSPANEIILFTQIWSAFIANTSTVGIFNLAAILAAHACGQLNIVMEKITEFVNESRNRRRAAALKELGLIVEHHLKTLNFISCIEEVMNRICFFELFRCTLVICIIGYWILMDWADQNTKNLTTCVMMFMAICFNIFIMCYIGEILTEQCKKVGDVVYMTNWYHLPEKIILHLILIIARSSVVVEITAGKLVHMTLYTFGDVIKTGFVYLNFLRKMS
ncbi:unnamed protein product [Xylocopa violacea]|uniref:Odorant receptor n=1 Tax=Xylocopa violacea TaxID=135666 RepID=A0ABP1N6Q7_XYLVO